MKSVDRGVLKVQQALGAEKKLFDTEPGRQIFSECMKLLTRPISEAQEEARTLITGSKRGVKPVWCWLVLPVPADKLAFITIRSILTIRMAQRTIGRKANAIVVEIGNNVRMQTEFEAWLALSRDRHDSTGAVSYTHLTLPTKA